MIESKKLNPANAHLATKRITRQMVGYNKDLENIKPGDYEQITMHAVKTAMNHIHSDTGKRELQLIKRFLADLRVLRNHKPNKDNNQNLKYSIVLAKAMHGVYVFLSQNYIRDNNTSFDLYSALSDPNYGLQYMSNFTINNRVRDLYFTPRSIEIIYNKENGKMEAVFNKKEHVDLHYGAIDCRAPSIVIHAINHARYLITKEYHAVVNEMNGTVNEQDLKNYVLINTANSVVNEPEQAVAQWILDNNINMTVQDFTYAYTTPHCLRTLVRDGIGAVNLNANPYKYNPQLLQQLREESSVHVYDPDVQVSHTWEDV